jgi:hypothetical protein
MEPSPPKRAFIIRPFGVKQDIDFDRVERDLIAPALAGAGVDGRTTLDILRAGNIRVDMFQRLLTADLVVADVSIHNANVFYELGIRHAFREKRTFLLRCRADDFPFDLQTDRYFEYEPENPGGSLEGLTHALQQTLASRVSDSPVFHLLPGLIAQHPARFLPVPEDFQEAVAYAAAHKQFGDLELLAEEIQDLEWAVQGLRVVGNVQFDANKLEGARITWEAVVKADPTDIEGHLVLGTIYQRLGDLPQSDLVLARVMRQSDVPLAQRAEAFSLMARNAKAQWLEAWQGHPEDVRQTAALRSPFLEKSHESYFKAFQGELNHFYSGLNALAMVTVLLELIAKLPQVWEERFENLKEAKRVRTLYLGRRQSLAAGVELSVQAALSRLKQEGKRDVWSDISQADLVCLTSKRPARVNAAYRRALADAPDFAVDAAMQQLVLYKNLGVLSDNVDAVLSDPVFSRHSVSIPVKGGSQRVILFTGHMIDKPDRPEPRFPPDKEEIARRAIHEALVRERDETGGIDFGLAGGASGGDLLFHEICQELGIDTRLYLALPSDPFIQASVAPGGQTWVERFHRLYQRELEKAGGHLKPDLKNLRILADSKDLPHWLQDKPDYSIWQRNNLWMLHNALVEGGKRVTVIALWNGEKGDGPGGTADLVAKAKQRGAKIIHLHTKEIFSL